MRYITAGIFSLAFAALLLLAGCGGSGGTLADGGIIGTGSVIGTVPGTVIEAYGDNGDYRQTSSEINSTDKHPFRLQLKAGIGYYLVMIINEGTENEIVMPISFPDDQGQLFARIVLREGQEIDLGHIPLYLNCNDVLQFEPDEDCSAGTPYVFKNPFILDEDEGSHNPLRVMDADDDGIDDYDDEDHGYGQQNGQQYKDPQDHDDDRVPNYYDDDFSPGPNDQDEDGIDDDDDENPGNIPDDDDLSGWNGQGMHPLGQAWQEQHGDHAEQDLESCAVCHGDDFRGTQASGQIGCYGCHVPMAVKMGEQHGTAKRCILKVLPGRNSMATTLSKTWKAVPSATVMISGAPLLQVRLAAMAAMRAPTLMTTDFSSGPALSSQPG